MEGGHQMGLLRDIKSESPPWRLVPQVLGLCCHHGSLTYSRILEQTEQIK